MDSDPNTSLTSNDKPKCFRIANVPPNWSHDNLLNSLQTIDPSLQQMDRDEYQLSLYPSCYGSTQTALLNLRHCTEYFRQLKLNDFNYPSASSGAELVIDSHFYDLTPLNSPRDEVVADVVAVTGLAGHAYGSWRSQTTYKMWLKDFLPEDVTNVRIMTYGYDSTLVGSENSAMSLNDYKRNFIQQLGNARTAAKSRPIIFLGHSLGGILILQVLIASNRNPCHRSILDSTGGIFFFATPHQGLRTDELEEMVDATTGGQRRNLIMQLKEGSDFMENQKEELIPIWNNFEQKVCSFYETVKTPSVRMIETDRFARDGEVVQMVQRSSALLNLPYEDRIPATKNHTDIVKFATPADGLYLTVIKYMKECIAQTRRERILQLLRSSKEVIYLYSIDQDRYLENLQMGCNFEHDGRYFWIFRNLDYQKWLELEEDVMVLVLRGSPILEHAAFEVFRTLQQEREASDLFLYFFFGSTAPGHSTRPQRPSKTANWQNLAIVCSLLKVAIDNHPQQQSLLETFMNEILELKDDTILDKLPANPREAFTTLLCCATDQNLWDALGHVLRQATPVDGPNTGSERHGAQRNKRNLALIVDLNNLELGRALISHITQAIKSLRQDYLTVRLLVTNPPTGDLGLQQSPAVLIEYDKERQDCLRTLRIHNSRYETISKPSAQTFQWLWESPEYRDWYFPEHSSLLFIEGKPGSGKSTLVKYFSDNFQADGAIIAKFFYSYREGELERDHRNMLQSLLYDILKADESFFIHFQEAYRKLPSYNSNQLPPRTSSFGTMTSENCWAHEVLKDTLNACLMHPLKQRFLLVIDAMDESDDAGRADIVQFLRNLVSADTKCVLKIFLASRPINELQQALPHRILLQDKTKEDIKRCTDEYLKDVVIPVQSNLDFGPDLTELNPRQGSSGLVESLARDDKAKIKLSIVEKADGVFMWVRLVVKELTRRIANGSSLELIREFIKDLPPGLESYYEHMLRRLGGCFGADVEHGIRILQFCLFSSRPLQLCELNHALAMPAKLLEHPPQLESWKDWISSDIRKRVTHCGGNFAEIKNNDISLFNKGYAVVEIMHQTVREFFLGPHKAVASSQFEAVTHEEAARTMIWKTCISYLTLHLAELNESYSDDYKFVQYLNGRPFIKYSLEFFMKEWKDQTRKETPRHSTSRSTIATAHIPPLLLPYWNALQNCPSSEKYCILKRLANFSAIDGNDQQYMNRLLGVAAKKGYFVAVGNLLAAGASCNSVVMSKGPLPSAVMNGHEATAWLLVDSGARTDAKDGQGRTALHIAAWQGNMAIVQMLLRSGASINQKDNRPRWSPNDGIIPSQHGRSALHLAALYGHQAIVEYLLLKGADIKSQDDGGRTALHLASASPWIWFQGTKEFVNMHNHIITDLWPEAKKPYEELMKLLIVQGAHTDTKDINGATALHLAAQCPWIYYENRVRLLLQKCADVEAKDSEKRTALHFAVKAAPATTVNLLLNAKANIHAKDADGLTVLQYAVQSDRVELIRLLLNKGADIEAKDSKRRTALHFAVKAASTTTVHLLLTAKANTNVKDADGLTALQYAVRRDRVDVIWLLLNNCADIEAKDSMGRTALHVAAKDASAATVNLLLDAKANIHAKDANGLTVLQCAVQRDRVDVIWLLLNNCADIEVKDLMGRTALHVAARAASATTVNLLLIAKANIHAKDADGLTVLQYAVHSDRMDVIRLLLNKGADIEAKDSKGRTALHVAAKAASAATVNLLLDAKANIHAKDADGLTVLQYADQSNFVDVMRLLGDNVASG